VPFGATASGGQGPLSYTWTDTVTGSITSGPTVVSNELSPTLTLCGGANVNESSAHNLELSVTDGNTTVTAFITVNIDTPQIT